MKMTRARRRLAGFGLVAALTGAAATPAMAAEPAPTIQIFVNNITVAPDGPEKWGDVLALVPGAPDEYVVTIDRTGISGFAAVDVPSAEYVTCTADGAVLSCKVKNPFGDAGLLGLEFSVTAKKDAVPGDSGELAVTVSAPGLGSGSYRSTIRVGEGVDLVAGALDTQTVQPGGRVVAPLTVANRGDRPVNGAVLLVFGASYGLSKPSQHSNCTYLTEMPFDSVFACTFDAALQSGDSYGLAAPLSFEVPADIWAPSDQWGHAEWFTVGDWEDFASATGFGELPSAPGTGEPLTLQPIAKMPARTAAAPQTDISPYDNGTDIRVEVHGNNRGDLAAVGATLTGNVGDKLKATVGVKNVGPVVGSGPFTVVLVSLPEGTTAVAKPADCEDVDQDFWDEYGAGRPMPEYLCFPAEPVQQGETAGFTFTVRLDRADSGASGTVSLMHLTDDGQVVADRDPANDTAKIMVNPTAGAGGGLPVTGAPTWLLAGLGTALLALGAAGFAIARRRRIRFVA